MSRKTDHEVVQALLEGTRDRLRSLSPADTSEALLVIHNLREVAVAASLCRDGAIARAMHDFLEADWLLGYARFDRHPEDFDRWRIRHHRAVNRRDLRFVARADSYPLNRTQRIDRWVTIHVAFPVTLEVSVTD